MCEDFLKALGVMEQLDQTQEDVPMLEPEVEQEALDGKSYRLSPQAKKFLLKLIQAEGEEVSKQDMAYALGLDSIRYADIKKRHPLVFDTFVVKNNRGQYFLNNDYLEDVLSSA